MKKIFLAATFLILSAFVFGGCAEVEFVHQRTNLGTVTRQYTIYLDQNTLEHDFEIPRYEMKEFLFRFFGRVIGVDLTQTQYISDSYKWEGEGEFEGITQEISYKNVEHKYQKAVIFTQQFMSQELFEKYMGIDGKDDDDDIQVEWGFFFYTVTQKIDFPFAPVKEAFDREEPGPGEARDWVDVFMWGQGNFEGFRAAFPHVEKRDANLLVYSFILAVSGNGYSSPDADKSGNSFGIRYFQWERSAQGVDSGLTIVRIVPNSFGWNILGILLTMVFAGVLELIWYLNKNKKSAEKAGTQSSAPPQGYYPPNMQGPTPPNMYPPNYYPPNMQGPTPPNYYWPNQPNMFGPDYIYPPSKDIFGNNYSDAPHRDTDNDNNK